MVTVEFNEATKKVSLDPKSLADLDAEAKEQAESSVELVNRLMTDLVGTNGDVPPTDAFSKNISVSAGKLVNNGTKAMLAQKPDEAVKLLSTALEMVLRRPLWESTGLLITEVKAILMPRCDAYIALKQWADAYADASLLMLMNPQDAANHFRKGVILASAGRKAEALEYVSAANRMAPENNVFAQVLKSMIAE